MFKYLLSSSNSVCQLGSMLLPEPLKPKAATLLPSQPPSINSQKLQEPLKPIGLKPISQTPPPFHNIDHLAPQAPPRSKSAQNLPVEPVTTEPVSGNGWYLKLAPLF